MFSQSFLTLKSAKISKKIKCYNYGSYLRFQPTINRFQINHYTLKF